MAGTRKFQMRASHVCVPFIFFKTLLGPAMAGTRKFQMRASHVCVPFIFFKTSHYMQP